MLNAPTRRKSLLRGQQRRYKLLKQYKQQEPDFNDSYITCAGVEYTYFDEDNPGDSYKFGPANLMLEQGQLIALQSKHRGGKQTFLKLLGRLLLPTEGFIFYPENLRVRCLGDKPMIFNTTVLENLRFGNQMKLTDEQIWEVCDMLKIGHLREKGDKIVGRGGEKLSSSTRTLVGLARALLSSVDFLLLANTLDSLTPQDRLKVVGVLKEMIDNRGMKYAIPEGSSIATR